MALSNLPGGVTDSMVDAAVGDECLDDCEGYDADGVFDESRCFCDERREGWAEDRAVEVYESSRGYCEADWWR